jgi:gas vesicle protein
MKWNYMEVKNMRAVMNFLMGLILGSLLGAILALLFAPFSGRELIDRIQSESVRIQSQVSKAASDRRIELEQQLEVLRTPGKKPQQ